MNKILRNVRYATVKGVVPALEAMEWLSARTLETGLDFTLAIY